MVGLSILMAYAFNSSGSAVVVAILMHAAFNASPRFIDPFLDGTLTRERPSPEVFIALAFWTLVLLAVLFTRGLLYRTRAPSDLVANYRGCMSGCRRTIRKWQGATG